MPPERYLIDSLMPLALEIRRMLGEGLPLPFQGSDLFNDRWLLRAVLDAAARSRSLTNNDYITSRRKALWCCDATLETPFARRFEGDHLGEDPVRVGAVVASLANIPKADEPVGLAPRSPVFMVFDSYLKGDPSEGPAGFPWYGRAARILACMAQTAQTAGIRPGDIGSITLLLISPGRSLAEAEAYRDLEDGKAAAAMISSRVHTYRDEDMDCYNSRYEWLHSYLRPFAAKTRIISTDWFTFLAGMYTGRHHRLYWFLLGCCYFAQKGGAGPTGLFCRNPDETRAALRDLADAEDR